MTPGRERDHRHEHTLTWIAAGTVVGLITGAVVAERLSGRTITVRSLLTRGQSLAQRAASRWEPLVEAAIAVRDAWEGSGETEGADERQEELDDDLDEDLEDDLDDGLEDDLEDDDLDEDLADDLDDVLEEDNDETDDTEDEYEDEVADEDGAPARALNPVDERVLEAFSNDPVLAMRDVEIEGTPEDGIILHGRVHTAREVAYAVTIARGVPGVTAVRQRLAVRDRR